MECILSNCEHLMWNLQIDWEPNTVIQNMFIIGYRLKVCCSGGSGYIKQGWQVKKANFHSCLYFLKRYWAESIAHMPFCSKKEFLHPSRKRYLTLTLKIPTRSPWLSNTNLDLSKVMCHAPTTELRLSTRQLLYNNLKTLTWGVITKAKTF